MTFAEFLEGAQTSTLIQDAQKELAESELPFPPGHASQVQRDRDWSLLANQVV